MPLTIHIIHPIDKNHKYPFGEQLSGTVGTLTDNGLDGRTFIFFECKKDDDGFIVFSSKQAIGRSDLLMMDMFRLTNMAGVTDIKVEADMAAGTTYTRKLNEARGTGMEVVFTHIEPE